MKIFIINFTLSIWCRKKVNKYKYLDANSNFEIINILILYEERQDSFKK